MLQYIGMKKGFLGNNSKVQKAKMKLDRCDCMKRKQCCTEKEKIIKDIAYITGENTFKLYIGQGISIQGI